MISPGDKEKAHRLVDQISQIPHFYEQGHLNFSPIIRFAPGYQGHVAEYERDEQKLFESNPFINMTENR